MLSRLKHYFKDRFIAVKLLTDRNKFIFIASAAAAVLGVVLAVTGVGKAAEKYSDGNIITKLSAGEFNFLPLYIKLLLFTSAFYLFALLTSFNCLVYLINLPVVLFYAKFVMRTALVSCVLDGFSGYVLLIIFYLPLFIVNWFLFTAYLAEIFDASGCGCSWKYITPLKCHRNATGAILKRYLCRSLLFNIIFTAVILIILAIIF